MREIGEGSQKVQTYGLNLSPRDVMYSTVIIVNNTVLHT